MEMLNRCLEITDLKRAALERFDQDVAHQRHLERKEMIAARKEARSPEFGNRKERRRQAALQRKEIA
jgi:hypothetical protein